MKRIMACTVLLALATAIAGCGGSGSTASTTAAASVGAATNAVATASPGATNAGSTIAAAMPTLSAVGGDTCKFLSASDAATLLANPGPVKVTVADAPVSKVTTCLWGNMTPAGVMVMAQELKAAALASEIKAAMLKDIVETILGLGDGGGFETKTADAVTVTFIKGSTVVLLGRQTTGGDAGVGVAVAKKIADEI